MELLIHGFQLKSYAVFKFIKGTCCPHYDEEPERKPMVKKLLIANKYKNIFAIDGGAACISKTKTF